MIINGRKLPIQLKTSFVITFMAYFFTFSMAVPLAVYLLAPLVLWLLHGIPMSVSIAKTIGFNKVCYLVLFLSFWVSFVLWVREFVCWYRKLGRYQDGYVEGLQIPTPQFKHSRRTRKNKRN